MLSRSVTLLLSCTSTTSLSNRRLVMNPINIHSNMMLITTMYQELHKQQLPFLQAFSDRLYCDLWSVSHPGHWWKGGGWGGQIGAVSAQVGWSHARHYWLCAIRMLLQNHFRGLRLKKQVFTSRIPPTMLKQGKQGCTYNRSMLSQYLWWIHCTLNLKEAQMKKHHISDQWK